VTRPDRDEWHLEGANWLAKMGDCTRRKVGALIVGPDKRFLGMGYNGSYPGGPSCLAGDCPRGRHYKRDDYAHYTCRTSLADMYCTDPDCVGVYHPGVLSQGRCGCGKPWPCPDAVAPGSSYDTGPGACHATHAETNATSDAQRRGGGNLAGSTMYVSCEPCEGCVRHVRNTTSIEAIIWPGGAIALPSR
jgi:dCMP deaminase